jgi:hypothetical protein
MYFIYLFVAVLYISDLTNVYIQDMRNTYFSRNCVVLFATKFEFPALFNFRFSNLTPRVVNITSRNLEKLMQ